MKDETPSLAERAEEYQRKHDDGSSMDPATASERAEMQGPRSRDIVVAATFTADLLQKPLGFWMEKLAIPAQVKMAPYAQVMQELLDPQSTLSQNATGINILLVRLSDWVRDRPGTGAASNVAHLRATSEELAAALRVARERTSAPMLVLLCPAASSLCAEYSKHLEQIQCELQARLRSVQDVHCCTHQDLVALYPVAVCEDDAADRIGHIPFTQEYFVAMATLLARRITSLVKPQYKVIAIDCDNTLWKGICGEDGPIGIELTAAHLQLQQLLVRQHEAGMLLCLCSKNNPADVEAVFEAHPHMPLRREHVICSRINWEPKSANLRAIAEELGLGLDSFIFIDDSRIECAEVGLRCPAILCLQFPQTEQEVTHFLNHVWAFDRTGVTREARERTKKYRQNRARADALAQAASLEQFLASLELKIDVVPMQSEQLPRVTELIQRTNQFNMTSIRRTAGEIQALVAAGELQILVVHVRDRFGDYGLVGAIFFRQQSTAIDVDTFALSCRALGRGVEHRMVEGLARIGECAGASNVVLRYRRTARNAPAWKFLESLFRPFLSQPSGSTEVICTLPIEQVHGLCQHVATTVGEEGEDKEGARETPEAGGAEPTASSRAWHETAYQLSRVADIVTEIWRAGLRSSRVSGEYVAARTLIEATVAQIWAEVLRLDAVGIRDDFFELGGDSLTAVQAMARVGSLTGRELPLHAFFAEPTIERVTAQLADEVERQLPIERRERDLPGSLSLAQQRLWFIDELEGGSAAYHIPLALRLKGRLETHSLQAALHALVQRHETLRTTFVSVDGEPMQKVAATAQFQLALDDMTELSVPAREAELLERSRQDLATAFDLSSGPLIRGRLLRFSDEEHVLLITMHHIISDGWSIGVLIRELAGLYAALAAGRPQPLAPLSIQYADYAAWHRQWLGGAELRESLRYWTQHLRGAPALLELPTDRLRPAVQSYRGASVCMSIDSQLTAELRVLSRRFNVTLAMTLFTAWTILLSRLSGQEDLVIGMPVANRRRPELETLIGFFVNTLAVRLRFDDDPDVVELLTRVKATIVEACGHQDTPFEQVVEALQPVRSLSYSPTFQVMFVMQPVSRCEMSLPGLTLTQQEVPLHTAQFDLTLSLQESADTLCGSLNYATDLFDRSTAERWMACFESVLRAMVREPNVQVSRLSMLSAAERHRLAEQFNATQADYPREKLIHGLFEEQVERTPHEVAVIHAGEHLTYRQLNCRANQLARHLIACGAGPDRFVGLCVERNAAMVVGMLGILKSGSAYVPLDPNYPQSRIEYMLADTAPIAVITQRQLKGLLPNVRQLIVLDEQWSDIAQQPTTNLTRASTGTTSANLAYVIYTSGSTGQPKGVAIEHRQVTNLICWAHGALPMDVYERTLHATSLNFDLSVYECFVPLTSGGSLRVVQSALALVSEPADVTLINTVPSAISSVMEVGSVPPSTRVVNLAGEALKRELVERIFAHTAVEQVCNLYGPSETTTYSTWIAMPRESGFIGTIGRPIANTQIYILDRHRQIVPIGVVGEIHIGGAGVARGYLNRPELTVERFLADPFASAPGARMYKTGDLGRWRADGTIEYLGRNDHQVKVRGFRIELGEIEARLIGHARVKEAAVIAREDAAGGKRLVAYLVAAQDDSAPDIEQLREYLKAELPDYMVPSAFVLLPSMPLTPNGKLDRQALPAPEVAAYVSRHYEAPQGEVEEILAGIWEGLLRVQRVSRHDNFFELGGHSLLIVQMMARLRRMGLSTELRLAFASASLTDLARALTREAVVQHGVPPNLIPVDCQVITPEMLPLVQLEGEHIGRIARAVPGGAANIEDIYPLTPLQEGMLFHHLLDDERADTYVLSLALCLETRELLDELIRALQCVIDRHDVLRTAVLWEDLPRPVQVVYRKATLVVNQVVLDTRSAALGQIEDWLSPARQRLDLHEAPLLRVQMAAEEGTGSWYLLLQLHHIAIDHVTLEIITAELIAHLKGRAWPAPAAIPYRNHVAQALACARTHEAEAFFRSKLADVDEPVAPFGLMDVHRDGTQSEEASEEIEAELAQRARLQARRFGVSTATLFHAAWALVVARTSCRDDVVFGTLLLGRMQGGGDAQHMLGMFINTLPLRLNLLGATVKDLVERTQRELVELLNHEQSSLAIAQRCSGVAGSAPLFSALLNYRHSVSRLEEQWSGVAGLRLLAAQERTNYPIALSIDDLGTGFTLTAQTDTRLDPRRITSLLHTALRSLTAALEQSPQAVALELPILPESERHQVIEQFNATRTPYPREKLLHELFEAQVARAPNAIAAVCDGRRLTYADVNRRSNQLARYLAGIGVAVGDYVPVVMKRCLRMLIAHIALLKCGGVYVPVDPDLPRERRAFMIGDCRASLILADHAQPIDEYEENASWVDCAAVDDVVACHAAENLNIAMPLAPGAYVMYTSGSTGVPKGVVIEQRGVSRLVINNRFARLQPDDCFAHYSAPAFDASTLEVWGALLNGARLVIVPQPVVLDERLFAELLIRERVTVLYMSVGLFNQYATALGDALSRLRYLMVGGDSLEPQVIRELLCKGPPRHLLNVYGPTECTTLAATFPITSVEDDAQSIPIGYPIANTQVYILDKRREPVPIGATGEIYIGGDGVARGYLNRPDLTAQRFLADPFADRPQARMYRTGDLGRWRADGAIEFLGRNDLQVKIRGFRVELGEIESRLAHHPQVKDVVVLARQDAPGEKRLVAYLTVNDPASAPSVEDLRSCLKCALPEYMVPAAFVTLDRLPLSASGKVDRRALPAPEADAYASVRYEPPSGALEEAIAKIWQDVLGVDRVGRNDNFFDLGGHSLLALRALLRVNQLDRVAANVTDLYRNPTVHELALHIGTGRTRDEFVNLSREAVLDEQIVARPLSAYRPPPRSILVTGATGFVGRFLLAQLLQDTDATIHCLVRARSAREASSRLRMTLATWNLWQDEFESRLVAIPGDLRLPRLGMEEPIFRAVSEEVAAIFHCGTSMNHLETYPMAKAANVDSAGEILRLATLGRSKQVNYISTLGVFGPSDAGNSRVVRENTPIDHERHSTASGYVASKWVGEKIFMLACERGIPCNIFRLGLIWADTLLGRYDELQHVYRLLKSALLSGYGIQGYHHEMIPTPVDYVASAVVFLAQHHPEGAGIFHLSSPRQMVDGWFERCNEFAGTSLRLVPFYHWVQEMKRCHSRGCLLPIVPLIEYAFSMDEKAFYEHQRRTRSRMFRVNCDATHRQLEAGGIFAPTLDDDLLKATIDAMLSRDPELQGQLKEDAHCIDADDMLARTTAMQARMDSRIWQQS